MISEIVVYRGKEYDATILSDYIWIRSKSSEDMNRHVSVRLWPVHLSNMEVWFKCDDNHLVGRNTEVHPSLFVVAPKAPEYNYYEGEYYYVNVLDLDTFKQIVAYAEMCGMISHETGDKFIQRAITQKATLDDID